MKPETAAPPESAPAPSAETVGPPRALHVIGIFLHEALRLTYAAIAAVEFYRDPEEGVCLLTLTSVDDEDAPLDCPDFFGDLTAAIEALEDQDGADEASPLLGSIIFDPESGTLAARHFEDFVTLFRQIAAMRGHGWNNRDLSFHDRNNPVPESDDALNDEQAQMADLLLEDYPDLLADMCNAPAYASHKAMQRDVLRAYNLAANSQSDYFTYTLDDLDRVINAHHARNNNFSDPHKPGLWLH